MFECAGGLAGIVYSIKSTRKVGVRLPEPPKKYVEQRLLGLYLQPEYFEYSHETGWGLDLQLPGPAKYVE